MGITIKEVLNLPVVKHSELLAGFNGRERIVDGIALLESTDSTRWLTKNCLILTNAQLLKDNPEWASRLIHTLHQKNCAGIALKVKRHLMEPPPEMLSWANKLGIPIISLPYQCTSTQLINTITYEIFRSESHDLSYSYDRDFLMTLLLDHKDPATIRNQAVTMGWSLKKCLGVAVCYPACPELSLHVQELAVRAGFSWVLSPSRHYILVYDLDKQEEPETMLEEKTYKFSQMLSEQCPKQTFHIGIGRTYEKLLQTAKSYEEAQIAAAMNIAEQSENSVSRYAHLGIFTILLAPENRSELERIMDTSILILERYDEENGTEYFKTLLSYYHHNGSIRSTAEALFVHYNTIRNRLQNIKNLLNISMTQGYAITIQTLMIILRWQKIYEEIRH